MSVERKFCHAAVGRLMSSTLSGVVLGRLENIIEESGSLSGMTCCSYLSCFSFVAVSYHRILSPPLRERGQVAFSELLAS